MGKGKHGGKKHKGKRKRQPPKNGTKKQIILRGSKASAIVQAVLQEMHYLRIEHSTKIQKKEKARPFEDFSSLERSSQKYEATLFLYGSHSKKRKHNLILTRMFNYQMLDMIELGIDEKTFKTSTEIGNGSFEPGSRPALIFHGEPFDNDEDFKRIKNTFLDFFYIDKMPVINLFGVDRVIILTATEQKKLLFRQYRVKRGKSGNKCPHISLLEMGPHIDFTFRRRVAGSEELQMLARQREKQPNKTKKNIGKNERGERVGQIHMHRQDLGKIVKLAGKRPKALRKTKGVSTTEQQS